LQAHQEAFALWRKLSTGHEQAGAAVIECQTWWEQNCLYLEPDVRQAFVVAYSNAQIRDEFVRIRADSQLILEASQKITAFPDILFNAVKLPPMSETETKILQAVPTDKDLKGG
jgi:hypothetical protein